MGKGQNGQEWEAEVGLVPDPSSTAKTPPHSQGLPVPLRRLLELHVSFNAPSRQTSILSIHTGFPDPNPAMKPRNSFHPTHNGPSETGSRN